MEVLRRIGGQRVLHPAQRGHAVDHRVVDLAVHREPATLHALDQLHLPQRPPPVQQRAVQPAGQLEQLPVPPRPRQRRQSHVVLEIDLVVLLPGPVPEVERPVPHPPGEQGIDPLRLDHLVVEPRHVVPGPFGEHMIPSGPLGQLEQHQPADVHGLLTALTEQEHRVQRPHRGHGASRPGLRSAGSEATGVTREGRESKPHDPPRRRRGISTVIHPPAPDLGPGNSSSPPDPGRLHLPDTLTEIWLPPQLLKQQLSDGGCRAGQSSGR